MPTCVFLSFKATWPARPMLSPRTPSSRRESESAISGHSSEKRKSRSSDRLKKSFEHPWDLSLSIDKKRIRTGDLTSTDPDTDPKNDRGIEPGQKSLNIEKATRTDPGKSTERSLPQLPEPSTGKGHLPGKTEGDAVGLEK